ncbi:GtrA family protein [Acidaminobacter sp.]|uniref:GtrA family protein n=1 Tax=Acidaminobacter sp. TaxID=1872102 RepID=UPI00255D602C|nr:GtrA family protein [Acidaminobacter sp.]MDK9711868.1 GtrA family protein [Acidaminobacter sp.]
MPDVKDNKDKKDKTLNDAQATIGKKQKTPEMKDAQEHHEKPPNAHFAKEVSMYLVFGVLTTLINLATYSVLVMLGIHYGIATSAAFVLAVFFAYETNKRFVFDSVKATAREESRQIAAFFSSRVATFGVETAGLVLLIEVFGAGEQLSKYLMTAVVVVLNYVLSKHLVFKK